MGKQKGSKLIVVDWYEAASILGFNDGEMVLWIEGRMPFSLDVNPESEKLEFRALELNEFSASVYSLVNWGESHPEWRTLWAYRDLDQDAELVCRWVEARRTGVWWRSTMGNF